MARRPYTTDARFFSDSDQVVKVKWYPVAEPVECLPFPSKINSLDWSSFPYLAKGVGEVYGASRNYNGAKALPYAVGLEPCQPAEVFRDGEKRDPDLPPQVYNEDGFPTCCLDHFAATGGVLWGGAAVVNVVNNPELPPLCVSADLLVIPFDETFDIPAGQEGWFKFLTVVGSYDVNFISSTDPATTLKGYIVTCPPGGLNIATLLPGQTFHESTGAVFVQFWGFSASASAQTVRVSVG